MKRIIFLLLWVLFSTQLISQLQYDFKKDADGKVYFDEVIDVPGVNQAELFLNAKNWLLSKGRIEDSEKKKGLLMSNEKNDRGELFLEFDDKETGKIFGLGRTNTLVYNNAGAKKNGGSFKYDINILVKDNKTKIIIDNLEFEKGDMLGVNSGALITEDYPEVFGSFGKSQIKKQWELMRKQAIGEFETILADYKAQITKKSKSADW